MALSNERELMEMKNQIKLADIKEEYIKENRMLEHNYNGKISKMTSHVEILKQQNEELLVKVYKRENEVRLLQQKIREEEKNKEAQIEFSNTLCNVRFKQ